MGNIRSKDIKKVAYDIKAQYPEKFGADFEKNKEELKQMNVINQKIARNRVAGYITRIAMHGRHAPNY